MSKVYIGDVLILVYEEYQKARNLDFVMKPISYALYQTWKMIDKQEKNRLKEQTE